jgi:predicted enzyme related to lactoylglutathione lyase
MANHVVHFEIMGKDAENLRSFYKAAFGWDYSAVGGPMDYHVVQNAGIGGGIGGGDLDGCAGRVTFYVSVEDIDAALSNIESLGGKKLQGPHPLPNGGQFAHITDPEGHFIGLVQG